jgi:hypothetical protein
VLQPKIRFIKRSAQSFAFEAGNTNTGKIDWNYSIADNQLDPVRC